MAEDTNKEIASEASPSGEVKLNGLLVYKEGMSTVYGEDGVAIPVTILRYDPTFISQVKTVENDGYSAVQLACLSGSKKSGSKALHGHLSMNGLKSSKFVRELRQKESPEVEKGAMVSIESLAKGDLVVVTSKSKGHGFQGSVRRWSFAGGPASHGSKFHRQPGSSGNRTWPGRVMPGKKFPGHWGDETITVKNVLIVDVIKDESVVLVKGPIPGSRNTLVKLVRG